MTILPFEETLRTETFEVLNFPFLFSQLENRKRKSQTLNWIQETRFGRTAV